MSNTRMPNTQEQFEQIKLKARLTAAKRKLKSTAEMLGIFYEHTNYCAPFGNTAVGMVADKFIDAKEKYFDLHRAELDKMRNEYDNNLAKQHSSDSKNRIEDYSNVQAKLKNDYRKKFEEFLTIREQNDTAQKNIYATLFKQCQISEKNGCKNNCRDIEYKINQLARNINDIETHKKTNETAPYITLKDRLYDAHMKSAGSESDLAATSDRYLNSLKPS